MEASELNETCESLFVYMFTIGNHCLITLQQDLYAATNPPYSDDKDRQRGYNEVLDTKPSINHLSSNSWSKECSPSALQAMGNRLLDWFSVVMAEAKRRRSHNKGKGILHGSVFQTSAFVYEGRNVVHPLQVAILFASRNVHDTGKMYPR
jgi:hypothetical protein